MPLTSKANGLTWMMMLALASMAVGCQRHEEDAASRSGGTAPMAAAGGEELDLDRASLAFSEQIAEVVYQNRENCAAMAEALGKLAVENKALIERARAESTPEKDRAFAEKYQGERAAVSSKIADGLVDCGANKAVQQALQALQ